ncbi:MAG TPA: iduronate sulfatase, partial [Rhodopirellula sp.]|nr:iduronate sulfatase [Rhodopirellula sp.]
QADQIEEPAIEAKDLTDIPWVGRSMVKLGDDHKFRKAEAWQRVHRSYLACISWADYNVGRLLDALDASPHAHNTIVVLWSDHGYHQGEKRSFRKFSLWEESTRVPFLLMDTRQRNAPENRSSNEAVSLINIYRTLGDLCNLNVPQYVDGQSLADLLTQPDKSIDTPAITTWGRGNYTVRDDRYRYIRYFDGGEELYDHSTDPNEWKNLAGDSAYAAIKSQLSNQLPDKEAPLVRRGIALWNVIDADQPQKLNKFKNTTWPDWLKKMKPRLQ